jgi:signal transduction histidine kinase
MRKKFHQCNHNHFRHSLSGKLVMLFLLAAILFTVLVGAGVRFTVKQHFREQVQPNLTKYMDYIRKDIGMPPSRERASEIASELGINVFIADSTGIWSTNEKPYDHGDIRKIKLDHKMVKDGVEYGIIERHDQSMLVMRTSDLAMLFMVDVIPHPLGPHGVLPVTVLLVILLLLYFLTRHLISPVRIIREGLEYFGKGELDHRIRVNRRDELGDLADSFNAMADKVQQMLDSKRQLLLAISHELRSPLTRSRVAAELVSDPDLSQRLQHDLDDMSELIEELLETERLSHNHQSLNLEIYSISVLVTQLLDHSFKDRQIDLQLPENDIIVLVDVARAKLLLSNLIGNALRHTPSKNPRPILGIAVDKERLHITIQDSGEGIAPEHVPLLTEPFYRVDSARQRETGGYGLGLYLCRMIAEAHGGSLVISSVPGVGTRVEVIMPVVSSGSPE